MTTLFQPKQLIQYEASHLVELVGNVNEKAIEYSLELITPPGFSDGDTIHDNAAGSGAVTEAIMKQLPKGVNVTIEATDINEQFVAGCKSLAASKGWGCVRSSKMSAQDLSGFEDNKFTHSFTTFALHCLGDHDKATKEIYRSLKPGGVAVASIWTHMPHVGPLQHAHWRTRGKDAPMPVLLPLEGFREQDLINTLRAGGFEADNIKCFGKDCYLTIPDMKRWAQLSWSYLGHGPSGWSQHDEDKWEEAIDDIIEQMKSGDGITVNEKGETVMKMVASIAIARK